jgi:hypothetical protein
MRLSVSSSSPFMRMCVQEPQAYRVAALLDQHDRSLASLVSLFPTDNIPEAAMGMSANKYSSKPNILGRWKRMAWTRR